MDNNEGPYPSREKHWEEKDAEQKTEKLAEAVEILSRRVLTLEKQNALLCQHQHDSKGALVIPMAHNEAEVPWYYEHLLGRDPAPVRRG